MVGRLDVGRSVNVARVDWCLTADGPKPDLGSARDDHQAEKLNPPASLAPSRPMFPAFSITNNTTS